ncbi:hypothetical protein, partial [Bacteroides sp. AF27-33]|uniref:hypothetical protein n=2 Tax=Bacteroides TaxID=816 RepID=UPI001F3F8969
ESESRKKTTSFSSYSILGTSPSNRIVVTIETAVAIEDELNIIVCKKKGETLITANPLFY